jgi:hypothetical protein
MAKDAARTAFGFRPSRRRRAIGQCPVYDLFI